LLGRSRFIAGLRRGGCRTRHLAVARPAAGNDAAVIILVAGFLREGLRRCAKSAAGSEYDRSRNALYRS
jgi:hypothetical protein